MLPTAHTSIGFLISQIKIKGKSLSTLEIIFVVFCANVFDLDLIYVYLGGQTTYHHLLVSHTPLFAVGLIALFTLIFRLNWRVALLGFVAMLSHFVLDDLCYWLYLFGITEDGKPEIFWLFPFDPRREEALRLYSSLRPTVGGFLVSYIKHPLFIFEWIFLISATSVFANKYSSLLKKVFFKR